MADEAERATALGSLSVMYPYDASMGRFILDSLRDPALAWGAVELMYMYSGLGQLGPSEVERLSNSDPELLSDLLSGRLGSRPAWAMLTLLGDCGNWGANVLIDSLRKGEFPGAPSDIIMDLARNPGFDWHSFLSLIDSGDQQLAQSALSALAIRSSHDDEVFAWMEGELTDFHDPERQIAALQALQFADRDDIGHLIETEILPAATDGAVRAQALATYAFQTGADLDLLADHTDAGSEPDPEVRKTAALSAIAASRDMDASLDLLEGMVDDPDLGTYVRGGLAILYESRGDPQSMTRAQQLAPTGVTGWATEAALHEMLDQFATPGFDEGALAGEQLRARVVGLQQGEGSALARQLAGNVWLNEQLQHVAQQWKAHQGGP